ncbi:glutathione S-transferase family protein [Aquincola sp. S2]|uniref:Glutathione S-transferase family protein n=1 Tax=Pseudaquabacterium terrae TaxID=2732868 RepID=A0ABX2EH43_9BURK|nr:glutathione S-transferase family protein [Aquabacterium terrae]NRF67952.1 glutathione S-transferase family protein [Aquabacterium terrae]
MALTLYGYQGSGSAAIEAALRLADVPYELVNAASWDPASALDELKRVNPLAQIPTLVLDDGTVMSESAAILIELGLRYPASGLLPAEPAARASVLRGLVYIAANCYATIGIIDYPERALPSPSEDEAKRVVQRSRARLHELWDRFADQFPAHPFLGQAAPNALDLLATVVSKWSGSRPHLRSTRPAWALLFDKVEQHPALAAVFERHWPKQP